MASFNLTAQLNISGPANLKPVISNIRKQLSSINPNINININTANLASSSKSLQDLNTNLRSITVSATSAADAMRKFGAAVGSVNMSSLPKNMSAATQQSQQLQQQQARTAQTIKESGNSMVEFGKQSALAIRRFAAFTLVTGMIYKFTGALSSASDEFMKFNKQMVQLSQVTGTSLPGLAGLEREITSLSTSLGVSSSSLIDISSTLAQAGLSAQETEQALKALAKSTLAPSFDDLNSTVEGSIALMRQFSISTAELDGALGSINAVAAKFAVEAGDIITAIQRTGGVFAASSKGVSEGTQALNEFIAVFTSIRATTRESAETIATGLRTIFTRIQRRETIDTLKQFGVQLTDLEGKFVGPYEAVKRLSQGLSGLDTRDIRFSSIIEELGGFRQVGKVIPLLQQFATAEKALGVAQRGQGSLTADAAKAQQALAVQMTKVQEEFISLVRKIGSSNEFQTMVKLALNLASAFISVADSAKHALPAITALLAVKGTIGAFRFASGFMGGMRGGGGGRGAGDRMSGAPKGFARGGQVPVALEAGEMVFSGPETVKKYGGPTALARFNRTGQKPNNLNRAGGGGVFMVPGSGRGDNFKTTLPEGSFVIKRQSVRSAAADGGRIGYAGGGSVKATVAQLAKQSKGGAFIRNYQQSHKDVVNNPDLAVSASIIRDNIELTDKDFEYLKAKASGKKGRWATLNKTVWADGFEKIARRRKGTGWKRTARTGEFGGVSAPVDLIKKNGSSVDIAEVKFTHENNPVSDLHALSKLFRFKILASGKDPEKMGFTENRDTIPLGSMSVIQPSNKDKFLQMFSPNYKGSKIKRQRAAIGGLIQRLSGGTDEPLTFPGRAKLLTALLSNKKKFPNIRAIEDLIGGQDAREVLKGKNPSGPSFDKLMAEYGKVTASKVAKKATAKRLASTREFGVLGLRGPSGTSQETTPLLKSKTKGTFKPKDVSVQKGVLSGFLSKRLEAIARKGYRETVAQMAAVLADRAGTPAVSDKKALNAIIKKTFQGGGLGQMFESSVAAADSRSFYPTGKINTPMDLPKGSGVAGLFGVKEGIPTDVTVNTEENKTAQMGRFLRDKKLRRSRKALGGQVQRLAEGGTTLKTRKQLQQYLYGKKSKTPDTLVGGDVRIGGRLRRQAMKNPSQTISGFSPMGDEGEHIQLDPKGSGKVIDDYLYYARGGQVQRLAIGGRASRSPSKLVPSEKGVGLLATNKPKKLGISSYDEVLEKAKVHPKERDHIATSLAAGDYDPNSEETRKYIQERINQRNAKLSQRTSVSALTESLKTPSATTTENQRRIADEQRSILPDPQYAPPRSPFERPMGLLPGMRRPEQSFSNGTSKPIVRNLGYIDGDVLNDPANAHIVRKEMEKLGITDIHKYKSHLSTLAASRRKSKDLSRLSTIHGVAGSGKSTFVQGGSRSSEADNAKLRKTNRYPILTEDDILRSNQIIDSTSVAGPNQKAFLSQSDRIVNLSSRTSESQEILKGNRKSRDLTGKGLFGRKPGTTKSASLDSGPGEAYIAASEVSGVDPKKVTTLKVGPNFTRSRTNQPTVRSPEKTGLFYGNFGPTTAGHLSVVEEAKKMGISPQDFVALVGGDSPINYANANEHDKRTSIFPQKSRTGASRVGMAKASFGALGANVAAMPRGSGPGSIPNAFKVGDDSYIVPRGKNDIAFVGDEKGEGSLDKYTKLGYSVKSLPRTAGISGTAAREAIMKNDVAAMKKLLSPEGLVYVQQHLESIQKRPSLLESILQKFTKNSQLGRGATGKLASVKAKLSELPARKTKTTPPEVVAEMERLRKERDNLESKIGRRPSRMLSRLESRMSKAMGGEIPIMAQAGEFVLNKHAAGQIGPHTLKKLNRGGKVATDALDSLPKYHTGGMVQKFAGGGSVQKLARGGDVVLQKASGDIGLRKLERAVLAIEGVLGKFSPKLQQAFGNFVLELADGKNATKEVLSDRSESTKQRIQENNKQNRRGPLASHTVAMAAVDFGNQRLSNTPLGASSRQGERTMEAATANYVSRAASDAPGRTGPTPHLATRKTWDRDSRRHTTSSGQPFVSKDKAARLGNERDAYDAAAAAQAASASTPSPATTATTPAAGTAVPTAPVVAPAPVMPPAAVPAPTVFSDTDVMDALNEDGPTTASHDKTQKNAAHPSLPVPDTGKSNRTAAATRVGTVRQSAEKLIEESRQREAAQTSAPMTSARRDLLPQTTKDDRQQRANQLRALRKERDNRITTAFGPAEQIQLSNGETVSKGVSQETINKRALGTGDGTYEANEIVNQQSKIDTASGHSRDKTSRRKNKQDFNLIGNTFNKIKRDDGIKAREKQTRAGIRSNFADEKRNAQHDPTYLEKASSINVDSTSGTVTRTRRSAAEIRADREARGAKTHTGLADIGGVKPDNTPPKLRDISKENITKQHNIRAAYKKDMEKKGHSPENIDTASNAAINQWMDTNRNKKQDKREAKAKNRQNQETRIINPGDFEDGADPRQAKASARAQDRKDSAKKLDRNNSKIGGLGRFVPGMQSLNSGIYSASAGLERRSEAALAKQSRGVTGIETTQVATGGSFANMTASEASSSISGIKKKKARAAAQQEYEQTFGEDAKRGATKSANRNVTVERGSLAAGKARALAGGKTGLGSAIGGQIGGGVSKAFNSATAAVGKFGMAMTSTRELGGIVGKVTASLFGLQRSVVATEGKFKGMTRSEAMAQAKQTKGKAARQQAISEVNQTFASGSRSSKAVYHKKEGGGGMFGGLFGGGGGGPDDMGGSGKGGKGRKGARGRSGGGGGGGMGGMGMYAAEMGLSMAGSAAVEQLAAATGGQKTKEGREISTIGGSAVSGASMGMMMGSMAGPLGMAAGAAIGGIGGALYGQSQMPEIERQAASQKRMESIEKAGGKMSQNLSIASNTQAPEKTRKEAEARAQADFETISSNSRAESVAGAKKKDRTWAEYSVGVGPSAAKTVEERVESAQPAADKAKEMLSYKMQKTGKNLQELEASMPKAEFDKLTEAIALTDKGYQSLLESVYADGKVTDAEAATLERARKAAMEREGADVKAAGEAAKTAKQNAQMTQAMQKVTTSFEKMATAITAAAGRADKVMENGKLGIEAVDNPMAAVQQGQISQSADILSNPEAYSMNDVEGALRQNSSMAGSSSEAMVQSAMLPRKLEQSFGTAMQEAKAGGKDDPGTRDAVKKAMMGTVTQAFGPDIASGMSEEINKFLNGFEGDIREVKFDDLVKKFPELANTVAASEKTFAALQKQSETAAKAIGMIGDAAQKSAGKGQEIRNRDADTYSTVANSTLAFKRATGEKISYQADAGVRNQARATRLGTSAQVASSPQAMLDRYNQLNKATGTAATAQQQITEANRPALLSGDENQSSGAIKAMENAARTTAEFAQATQQARDEIMNLPNDIKENIGGIMQELQDVMQERAAKIGAAGGLMEKMLTSTPKDLRKMGNTFNNLNQTLSGKGVSFEQSQSANMAYNQARKQGGSHMQAQRSAQEAYAQESGDTISMAKELAPLLGAVDPEAQNKMMGSVYESMFAARGQDTSKMMVGDKSMKEYIQMMKEGGKKDPKVQALEGALAAQQGALQAANDAAKQLIAQEAEALTTKTGAAVLDAMIKGAEAVRVAVAEGKQIGITPPGEVGKPGAPQGKAPLGEKERQAKKAENEGKIAEAQKILNSGTASADDTEEARRTILSAEQENAILFGDSKGRKNLSASTGGMNYDDHKLEGETEEEFNKRKQKLQEMAEGTQPPPSTTPPQPKQATTAQAAANSQQAAAPAPATGTGQPAAAPVPATATGQPVAPTRSSQAATPAPTTNAVDETEQSKKNFDAERTSSEQTAKNATEAATVGAKPVSAPQQPQKVMSLKELKAQRSEDSKRLALKGAIGDYREQAEADPEGKTLDKTGVMTNKEFLADKEQQLSGMQDKFDEKNPELAAKRKKNAEDSQRRAKNGKKNGEEQQPAIPAEAVPLPEEAPLTEEEISFFNPGYKAPAATSQQPPQATGAQASANGQQAAVPVPPVATGVHGASAGTLPTAADWQRAANEGGHDGSGVADPGAGQRVVAQSQQATGAATPAPTVNASAQTAPSQPQRQGPMSYSDIRDQKKKQYEQSRYQKQQQYLSGFNEETREKMKTKLGSRLLEDPNSTTAPAQNNQLPGTAPASTRSGSSTPQASAPMGSPVAAPRNPQGQGSQNQGGGVLPFEAFANKLDILLTKLAEVNIPNEIRLTSEQLGVSVTLNGGEVMASLPEQLKTTILAKAIEELRKYDSAVTGGEGSQGTRPMGGQSS